MSAQPSIDRKPDVEGHGRAWRVTKEPTREEQRATVRAYIVHAPHGNPFWPWYVIACVHLREMVGVESPRKRFSEASHEFLIAAVTPDSYPNLNPDQNVGDVGWLEPLDLVHQVANLTDEQAGKVLDLVVEAVVGFGWSPDQDNREMWKRSIESTADHFRAGIHR